MSLYSSPALVHAATIREEELRANGDGGRMIVMRNGTPMAVFCSSH